MKHNFLNWLLLAILCVTSVTMACSGDIDTENVGGNPDKIIDPQLLGTWVFDHKDGVLQPGDHLVVLTFQNNGFLIIKNANYESMVYYSAEDGVLEKWYDYKNKSDRYVSYYRFKDGLLGLSDTKDTPDDDPDIKWYRRQQ